VAGAGVLGHLITFINRKERAIMKISRVLYGGTFSLGNYQNERLHLEAKLEEGDTPEEAVAELRKKVAGLVGPRTHELFDEKYQLERSIADLSNKARQAKAEYEVLSTFMVAQGLKAEMPSFPILKALLPAPMPESEVERTNPFEDEDGSEDDEDDEEEF
jgi:hypothetical protein